MIDAHAHLEKGDYSVSEEIAKSAAASLILLLCPVPMLMCGKVTHNNLIDSSPLFRSNSELLVKISFGAIMNNNIFFRRDRHGNARYSQEFA